MKITIVAPSGRIDEKYLEEGIEALRKEGHSVKKMSGVGGKGVGVFSATDSIRANDLETAIKDEQTEVIWCSRGGYGAVRTLETMDLDLLRRNKKMIVGFSDITAIHAVTVNAGGMGILGPMMKHIARHGTQAEDVRNTFALLRGETTERTCKRGEGSRNGHARAKIVGGNLSILYSLRGTPAEIETKGNILFIEDVSEYRYHIDRMMQNLRFGGVLKDLAGLVVGQMTDMKDGMTKFGQDAYGIIAEAVREYDYPVLMGFPSGHEDDENQPILLGGMCDLTVTDEGGRLRMGKDA